MNFPAEKLKQTWCVPRLLLFENLFLRWSGLRSRPVFFRVFSIFRGSNPKIEPEPKPNQNRTESESKAARKRTALANQPLKVNQKRTETGSNPERFRTSGTKSGLNPCKHAKPFRPFRPERRINLSG
jgi:hypothetical protein